MNLTFISAMWMKTKLLNYWFQSSLALDIHFTSTNDPPFRFKTQNIPYRAMFYALKKSIQQLFCGIDFVFMCFLMLHSMFFP